MSDQAILVTGAAEFICFHIARQLLSEGRHVLGLDSLNYDPVLKRSPLDILREHAQFSFVQMDLADRSKAFSMFWRDAGTMTVGIWYRHRSTARTQNCRFRSMTGPIIPSVSMPRPKRPTN